MNKIQTPNNTISEIQIWEQFDAIPIGEDPSKNNLIIKVDDNTTPLPEELEQKIDQNWKKIISKNKNAKDNQILFLKSPIKIRDGITTIETNTRNFRYTQAFNRNANFQEMTDELNNYKLLSISTHTHILTKDNKLLFGTKKNQFNQISGFSGFSNSKEDCFEKNGQKYLSAHKAIMSGLNSEMGHLTDTIRDIYALGITYVNTPALRGTDTDYLIKVDETSSNAAEKFQESFQFEKHLHIVDFHPDKIIEFVKNIHNDGKKMSKYALGCEYLVMKSFFGEKEANNLLTTIKDLGISISLKNETDYFKQK